MLGIIEYEKPGNRDPYSQNNLADQTAPLLWSKIKTKALYIETNTRAVCIMYTVF